MATISLKNSSICCAPETSFLVFNIMTLDQHERRTTKAEIREVIRAYTLTKYPASETHFTLVVGGSKDLKISQCKMEPNPPAEHPERIACVNDIRSMREVYLYRS